MATPGERVGRYEIVSLIGVGGMGEVYRAFDPQLNRHVAIKFLSADVASVSARRRFQQEAQAASALNHPHILTVHEAGEIDGRQYLVTEFVDGGTLTEWARGDQHTWRQVATLLVGAGDEALRTALATKYPTGALAHLTFRGPWAELKPHTAHLDGFFVPRPPHAAP